MHNRTAGLLCALGALGAACGGREAGTLAISIYGEDFIEEEIPATAFNDGWRVEFESFLVSVGEVGAAAGEDAEPGLADAQYRVFDLTQASGGAGHRLFSADVDGGVYDHFGYSIASSTSSIAGNADSADVELMTGSGFAVRVAGTASKGAESKSFAWGFTAPTSYRDCESHADVDGGVAEIEITIHGDHLFYDDLISHEPSLAFDLIAEADSDSDGEVTEAELAALDISTQERYQVGSLEIDDLWEYLEYSATTIGHVDGEGHCHVD